MKPTLNYIKAKGTLLFADDSPFILRNGDYIEIRAIYDSEVIAPIDIETIHGRQTITAWLLSVEKNKKAKVCIIFPHELACQVLHLESYLNGLFDLDKEIGITCDYSPLWDELSSIVEGGITVLGTKCNKKHKVYKLCQSLPMLQHPYIHDSSVSTSFDTNTPSLGEIILTCPS